jgi:hypothetical protein
MTEWQDPWKVLSPGNVDARRVDPGSPYDFFWIISGNGEPGLLLRIASGVDDPRQLPKMRNIDLTCRDIAGSRALVLVLKDPEQKELFWNLCLDIVRSADVAVDHADAVARAVRRTMRWHHLLRCGRNDLLSMDEQRGLVGELHFLHRLMDLVGPYAAIEAWKGPSGSSKDFELGNCLVEVKARRSAAKPFVQISSEDQLTSIEGSPLYLVVATVDSAIKPNGKTLTDHVLEIEKLFATAEPEAFRLWELTIEATGFDNADDYSDRRWTVGKASAFEVMGEFPRIITPLMNGVSSVRYSIALDACAPFAIEPEVLDGVIFEGVREWTI